MRAARTHTFIQTFIHVINKYRKMTGQITQIKTKCKRKIFYEIFDKILNEIVNKTVIVLMLYVLSNHCSRQVVFLFLGFVLVYFGLCSLHAFPYVVLGPFLLVLCILVTVARKIPNKCSKLFYFIACKTRKEESMLSIYHPYIFSHTFNRKTCAFCNIIMICSLSTRQQKRKENDREEKERQMKNHEVWY